MQCAHCGTKGYNLNPVLYFRKLNVRLCAHCHYQRKIQPEQYVTVTMQEKE